MQRELTTNTTVEVAYVGSNITHVGIPDSNLNQLTVDQLALGAALLTKRAESVLRHHSAVVVARRSDDPVAQLLKPYPEYTTVSLYRNNVGTTRYQGLELSLRQRLVARAARTRSPTRAPS